MTTWLPDGSQTFVRRTKGCRTKGCKIDQRMVYRIKELREQGKLQEEIAVEVGLTQGTVSFILRAHGLGGWLVKVRKNRVSRDFPPEEWRS